MARRTETVAIEGVNYDLTQMGAVEGRRLSVLFLKVCGPVLGHLDKLDSEALSAIAGILGSIDEEKLEPLWKAYAKNAVARPDGKRISLAEEDAFDEFFAGNVFGMWQFFVESSKLNFSDFLARAMAGLGSENEKAS
jgi:hypothetical protein